MSYKKTSYVAKPVDEKGYAKYSPAEHAIWKKLFSRQFKIVKDYACDEFIDGIKLLNLREEAIPQCPDISAILKKLTGWELEPVPALIPFERFFYLLANRKFPAATFMRKPEELDYLEEPDIFHEIFGHCPLLTNPAYAEFTHIYGQLGLKATPEDRVMLARLYWFTIEFGLINTKKGLRAYGGGILSSKNETLYSLDSPIPKRVPFHVLDVLRTPYRIDILQPIYFVLDRFETLYELIKLDLIALIHEARELGEYPPLFLKENIDKE